MATDNSASLTTTTKPIHSLVLDSGPLIKNDPSIDVLRARAEVLYTIPSVLPEIRDPATRARVETALLPFVVVRAPRLESIKHIQGFARRTGDLEVLSKADLEVLALGYELECERNGGDWRLRSTPGQKTVNGKPPQRDGDEQTTVDVDPQEGTEIEPEHTATTESSEETLLDDGIEKLQIDPSESTTDTVVSEGEHVEAAHDVSHEAPQPTQDQPTPTLTSGEKPDEAVVLVDQEEDAAGSDEEDADGWITPSNIQKHKAKDTSSSSRKDNATPVTLQAAILTSDFAMQNVALRMNLNLVSPELTRISRLRTWVLRCHACFQITRAMERRFCPSCGQPTLLRAACTVDDRTGAVTVHLKKNFQWNNRGNVYSVPKPVHGTSHGRAPKGSTNSNGGVGGWGRELIFAEDQKEFTRASEEKKRAERKTLDIMDQDYMPGILGGDRSNAGGKIRVGAGRNINAKKKR